MTASQFLERLAEMASRLRDRAPVLSGRAAAHVHLARATGAVPGGPAKHTAPPPREITAVVPGDSTAPAGLVADGSAVAAVVAPHLDLFGERVCLADGTELRVLRREVVLAQLLEQGGLAIALAGKLLYAANDPPIDIDEVRELLKAARKPDRFQPLLELVALAP